MARTMPTAADAAARWSQQFGAAGPRWLQGVESVTTAPGIAAAAASDRYVQGVNANVNKWASKVAGVSAASWKEACKTKGQGRLASGAQAGLAKYQSAIGKVLEVEKSVIAGLPARGTVEQNIQRSAAFQLAMHQAFRQG